MKTLPFLVAGIFLGLSLYAGAQSTPSDAFNGDVRLAMAPTASVIPSPADHTAPAPEDAQAAAQTVAIKNHLADPNYQLQADDVLEVNVFREPDLTTDGMIRRDGTFDMKLIGAIKVAGLTADQAAERIRAALAKDYLVDPRVEVGMVEYARKKVDVLGQVRSPGVYSFPSRGPLVLSDAVALAGGLLPGADSTVTVRRQDGDRTTSMQVDATARGDTFPLRPDDSVTVSLKAKRYFTVLGQVARPGTYDFPENQAVYLTDGIAVAGGFTRLADPSHVLVKRTVAGRESVQDVNAKAMEKSAGTQRLQLMDQDTITVSESIF